MRIMLILEASGGGAGRHVADLARGLLDAGDEVHLIYSSRRMDEGFFNGIADTRLKCYDIPMRRGPHVTDLSVLRKVWNIVHTYGPFDVIHSHSSKAGLIGRLVSSRSSVKCYTPHCIFTMDRTRSRPMKFLGWMVERALAMITHRMIAVAESERDHLLACYFPASIVEYIPNGVTMNFVKTQDQCRRNFGIEAGKFVFGSIARLVPQKNPELLIRAFEKVAAVNPDVVLLLVGTGELEDRCRLLAQELSIFDRIIWAGYRSAEDSLPAFDVFVMSSRYEAFPYVLIESLAAGLPVIATAVGGTTETIEEGRNGYLIHNDSVDDLAQSMARLASNAVLRDDFSVRSLEKSADFSASCMVKRTRHLYQKMLSNRSR